MVKDNDSLQCFIFDNAPVRGEMVHLNESFQAIIKQHDYPPFIQKLLGELLAAICLLSASIKFNGRLTVQFRGKNGLKLLLAQCTQAFELRGLAQWDPALKAEDVVEAFKHGVLAIMIDPEIPGGKRYQGIVEWKGASLAESLEAYFLQSEQLPTRIWLAVDENSAAGMMLQVMPKENPELHHNDWERLLHLSETVQPNELLHLDNLVLLHRLYHEEEVRLFESSSVAFQCNCSVMRGENAIAILGQKEAEEELLNNNEIVVTCEFCNKTYVFDRVDVARIFAKSGNPPTSDTLH